MFADSDEVTGAGPAPHLSQVLTETGKSLIRFGDGEALVLVGKPVWFQLPNRALRRGLADAFFNYRADSGYLLAVHREIFSSSQEIRDQDPSGKLWKNLRKTRGLEAIAWMVGARSAPVFDANVYRDGSEDPAVLWEGSSDAVLVCNQRIFDENVKSGRLGLRLHHVEVPEVDTMPVLERVCHDVGLTFKEQGLSPRETPVLVAAGSVGKLVVLRLMGEHRVLDVGAYLGWYPERENRQSLHRKKPEADV